MPSRNQEPATEASKNNDLPGVNSLSREPLLPYRIVLSVILSVGLVSALYATIPDCDEVFNYWEPTHYLFYGYGLQTWEYSPAYAIRSWLYVGIHSLVTLPFSLIPNLDKSHLFLILRTALTATAAVSQAELYEALSRSINPGVGLLFILVSVPSAGMFQAMPAYLPSSFAMYFVMFGMAEFLRTPVSLSKALTHFSIAGLLGWPFCLALVVPQLLFWMAEEGKTKSIMEIFRCMALSTMMPLALLATVTGIDSLAYRKVVFVPLNIVLYNVFGGSERGPDLYGTEPWWYYFANLSLNFNITAAAAFVSIVLLFVALVAFPADVTGRHFVLLLPFYLWFGVFSLQPHKEERFMYPAYPALCINAAMTLALAKELILFACSKLKIQQRIARTLGISLITIILIVSAIISTSRIFAITTAYSAPKNIYQADLNITGNVCFGKEWYRFPSSYFLPAGARPRFIKSAFAGLLPGAFAESNTPFRDGTWRVPKNMNDLNQEDPSKYIPIRDCDYLVDSYFEYREEDAGTLEPNYILDTENWDRVACQKFLDARQTPFLSRALWLPSWVYRDQRVWGEYCILRRKPKDGAQRSIHT
ncbi:mannosyltransferase [Orbilia blumenaviensis]|uniref:Mannosyltransferase n=1 Tax=Orbilia blumenaviensis TaxID=1796055 RepID=A0AAV9TYK8_9PEZI